MYLYYNMNLSEFVGGKTPCSIIPPTVDFRVAIEQQQVACRGVIREA